MAFVNASLLFGTLLVGVPILLHLVMRQQPKQLIFPALRFIKMRRETNRRTLQLRHWLLLLLRCLAIAVLAAVLARPSVRSAFVGNWILIGCLLAMLVIVTMLAALAWLQQRSKVLAASLGGVAAALLIAVIISTAITLVGGSSIGIGDRKAPVAAAVVIPVPAGGSVDVVRGFRVQLFAVGEYARANTMAEEARQRLQVEVHVISEPPHYKVRAGDFVDRTDAVLLKERAMSLGYDGCWVVTDQVEVQK